jgi:hypothetical protein
MKFWNFRRRLANVVLLREKNKIEFGVVKKELCCPDGIFLFLGRAGCEFYTKYESLKLHSGFTGD